MSISLTTRTRPDPMPGRRDPMPGSLFCNLNFAACCFCKRHAHLVPSSGALSAHRQPPLSHPPAI
eukprot:5279461-Pleurochrysis_carterae.AAC.1